MQLERVVWPKKVGEALITHPDVPVSTQHHRQRGRHRPVRSSPSRAMIRRKRRTVVRWRLVFDSVRRRRTGLQPLTELISAAGRLRRRTTGIDASVILQCSPSVGRRGVKDVRRDGYRDEAIAFF